MMYPNPFIHTTTTGGGALACAAAIAAMGVSFLLACAALVTALHRYWEEIGLLEGREFLNHDCYGSYQAADGRIVNFYCDPDRLEKHLLELAPEEVRGKARFLRLFSIDHKTYTYWYKRPYISTGPVVSAAGCTST